MSKTTFTPPICADLERKNCRHWTNDACRKSCLINPHGPEASAIIKALYEALKALRGNIGCASLVRNPTGIKLRAQADAALTKAGQ